MLEDKPVATPEMVNIEGFHNASEDMQRLVETIIRTQLDYGRSLSSADVHRDGTNGNTTVALYFEGGGDGG